MKYQVLFIDIDGTLLCAERKHLTKRSIDALSQLQSQGILVIPATGRGFSAIRPEILGGVVGDYNVCFNGACLLDQKGRLLYGHKMTHEQMDLLCRLAEQNNYSLGFSFIDGYYTYYRDSVYREFYKENNGDMECLINGTDHQRHLKDMPYSGFGIIPRKKAKAFNDANCGLQMLPFKGDSHDICQQGISKATGADQILKHLGIDWGQAVAIGDGANDCDLLREAGVGIAMGNAADLVKEAADFVTGHILDDGAADAIIKVFKL